MNALASHVTMVVLALMLLKAIGASVPLDLLDYNVTKRIAIVIKYHLFVPSVQCVETNQGLEISVAYADQDIQEKNVMSVRQVIMM